jgi:transcriptional regulator with XRE-family HTH domain
MHCENDRTQYSKEVRIMQTQKRLWIDVKRLREEHDWLQEEAAERLGVSRPYLSAIENGKRGISMNTMEAIMRVFHVKYEDFIKI